MNFQYKKQSNPDGLDQTVILGEDFIGDGDACLILEDNLFYGYGFTKLLDQAVQSIQEDKATGQGVRLVGYRYT